MNQREPHIYIKNLKETYHSDFVKELRSNIYKHNLDHDQIALLVGKSRSAISMWLSGRAQMLLSDALLLAKFFKMKSIKSTDDLFEEETT